MNWMLLNFFLISHPYFHIFFNLKLYEVNKSKVYLK